jgi:hypothetical protein
MRKKDRRRIREETITADAGRVKEVPVPQFLSFSYKYLNSTHAKFQYHRKEAVYFCRVLERFRELSRLTAIEIMGNRSPALRSHPIQWEETTEKRFGIPREREIVDAPYQFEITANQHGRVHGFFIGPVFYIVWFDPDHNLYPRR